MRTVLLAAGGTAGHVEPALATADALAAAGFRAVVLGTESGLEARLVPARGYDLAVVPRVPLPRRPGRDLLTVPLRLRGAVRAAADVIRREKPCVVVGFGGYVSVPAYLAARRTKVPIVVHEANARAGVANRLGARLTPFVAAANVDCGLPHARLVGIPLRPEIAHLDRRARRPAARAALGLGEGPVLLVTGGSQGAGSINRAVLAAAGALDAAGVSVLHHAGAAHAGVVAAQAAHLPSHHVLPYIERMADAYAAADLALCRAGAMTCAELAAVGLPAAYVPLPIGNGEQRLNAEPIVAAGGGLLVDDADLDGGWIERVLLPLLADPGRLTVMSDAARAGTRDAATALVSLVEEAAASGQARMDA